MKTGAWSAFPVATSTGVNYPNRHRLLALWPELRLAGGVLRAVGSY